MIIEDWARAVDPKHVIEFRLFSFGSSKVTDAVGKVVWFLDISPPLELLETLATTSKALFIIDHHNDAWRQSVYRSCAEHQKQWLTTNMILNVSGVICASFLLAKFLNQHGVYVRGQKTEEAMPDWLLSINAGEFFPFLSLLYSILRWLTPSTAM